jgi:hypothetical protein
MQPFDTQVVVDLSVELYSVLINLSYISAATLILPAHRIPETEIQRFAADMEPLVLDLIQRLPYIKDLYRCTVMQVLLGLLAKILYSTSGLHRIRWI